MISWVMLVTLLALLVFFVVTINVGRARTKYRVQPPKMSGDPAFERAIRVQQNTLEQLVAFLPALWIFAMVVSYTYATILGMVWVIGRILYAWGYYQAAEKRVLGFGITIIAFNILMVGSLVGVILLIVRGG
jgi:glutathione S-transferase